jgi:hypothetical protein
MLDFVLDSIVGPDPVPASRSLPACELPSASIHRHAGRFIEENGVAITEPEVLVDSNAPFHLHGFTGLECLGRRDGKIVVTPARRARTVAQVQVGFAENPFRLLRDDSVNADALLTQERSLRKDLANVVPVGGA